MSQAKTTIIIIATILAILTLPWLDIDIYSLLIMLFLYYLTIITLLFPNIAIYALLLTRPSLDILTKKYFLKIGNLNITPASYVGILAIFVCLFIIYKNKKKIKQIPFISSIAIFLFFILISIFYSFDRNVSILEFIRLSSIFLIYTSAFILINDNKKLIWLTSTIILSAIIPSLLAIYQFIKKSGLTVPFEGVENRIFGTFAHPNLLAYFLILPIALIFILFKLKKSSISNIGYSLFGIFLAITLSLTYTRGAWIAFLIILLTLGIYKYKKILITGLTILLLSYLMIEPINTRVNNTFTDRYSSINWRIDYWVEVVGYGVNKPILGRGAGSAENFFLNEWGDKYAEEAAIHNDYVKIFFENGLLGLAFYLSIIILLLKTLYTNFKNSQSEKEKIILLTTLSLTVAIFTMSLADNIIRNTALMWSYWAFIGAIIANTSTKELSK